MKRPRHMARSSGLAAAVVLLMLVSAGRVAGEPVVLPELKDSEIDAALADLKKGLVSESEGSASGRRSRALLGFTGRVLAVPIRGPGKNRSLSDKQAERIGAELAALKEAFPTQADAIDVAIFKARYLTIGRRAPEIEGQDIDGVSFKLSDYRGKVVVLDFWGDW